MAPSHAALYSAFGAWITACYGKAPAGSGSLAVGSNSLTFAVSADIDRVVLQENQTGGQYVVAFTLEVQVGSTWSLFTQGVTIGSKRISVAQAAVAGASAVRLNITEAFEPGHAGVTAAAFSGDGCAAE